MTKKEWIDTIKNTLLKVDEQGIHREPLLERHIQSVYEQMYNELYIKSPRGFAKYCTLVTESISGLVTLSDGRSLPTKPISLPRNNSGLFEFYTSSTTYILTSYEGYKAASEDYFDTSAIKGHRFATLLQDTLYGTGTIADGVTATYRMIPKFTELSLTDEVKVPEGMEEMLIDRVIDTIRHMTPIDMINDNTVQ